VRRVKRPISKGSYLAIPSPRQDVVTGLQILGDEHAIGNQAHDPVARARTHAVAVTPQPCAIEHAVVPRTRRWKLQAPRAGSPGRTGAAAWVVQSKVVVVDPRNGIPCPGRPLRPRPFVNKDRVGDREPERSILGHRGSRAIGSRNGLGVPHHRLLRPVKLERRASEALFCERLIGGAEAILVSTAVVVEWTPRNFNVGSRDPLGLIHRRRQVRTEVAHCRKRGGVEDRVASNRLVLVLPAGLPARIHDGSVAGCPPCDTPTPNIE
jgi:hypothetical protein